MNGVQSRFETFEIAAVALEVAIEAHRDECKALIENHVPPRLRADLLSAADDRAFQSLKGAHALAHLADEAHAHARPRRVVEDAA